MLKPWITLEKSSLVLGGQGKEKQSLHFSFHPKSQELGDRFESSSKVWIAHGKSTQQMPFWFMRDVAYLWFLFQVIMGESGGEWILLYQFYIFFLLMHNGIINYACHSQSEKSFYERNSGRSFNILFFSSLPEVLV